jgi:hypothetical protein
MTQEGEASPAGYALRAFPSAPRQAAIAAIFSCVRVEAQTCSRARLASRTAEIEARSIDGDRFGRTVCGFVNVFAVIVPGRALVNVTPEDRRRLEAIVSDRSAPQK